MQQTDPASEAEAHVVAVAARADVIGWNELGTLALQQAVRNLPGFTSYMPGPDPDKAYSANSVAISWRTDVFDFVDGDSIRVHGGVATVSPSRYINWVLLRHKASGKLVYRINTHVVHRWEVAGRPRNVVGKFLGQTGRAKKHIALLAETTARLGVLHPVIGGGDLNCDYLAEKRLAPSQRTVWFPYTVLGAVADLVEPDHGTHGARLIDWTWVVGPGLVVTSQTVLPHGSSDHNPVLSVVELV